MQIFFINYRLSLIRRRCHQANHLTGLNFTNWLKNLKFLLKSKHIGYDLEGDGLDEPESSASKDEI